MKPPLTPTELVEVARQIRIDIIRSLARAGSGHTGGSLGLAAVFACLYFNILNHCPSEPDWPERDRLILSIGHVAPVLYASLANAGYFDKEELLTLRKLGTRLQGHPDRTKGPPGIELSAGSLGQGLSVATGMALGGRIDNKSWRVYCILGDGELQEGSVWEAAMSAAHYKLSNLTAIVDRNGLQIDGPTASVMNIEPLKEKWESFGWNVIECDGNKHDAILKSFESAKSFIEGPSVIIARTIMGKGVPAIENNHLWHGKAPSETEALEFIRVLSNE